MADAVVSLLLEAATEFACLTTDLPGTGGTTKRSPEHFVVEEIPAYELCGTGEHLFLWIEKRRLSATDLVAHLAGTLGIRDADIGIAGMKDKEAITRQYVSVPFSAEPRVGAVDSEQVQVLRVGRHRNKLRTGHLRGNRFRIILSDLPPGAIERARPIVERLRQGGLPNYFGLQRFGRGGSTLAKGYRAIRERSAAKLSRRLRRLALSSLQSALFNANLARRLHEGLLHQVLAGEVMQVRASGGPFVVNDVGREQGRFEAGEIVPTGPLFGPRMRNPEFQAFVRESDLLARFGLAREQFTGFGKLMLGGRRALLTWPGELRVEPHPDGLEFRFTLPSGSYATVLLRELQKLPMAAAAQPTAVMPSR